MSRTIAEGIDWWLREEVRESNSGRNQVLDNFFQTRTGYLLPADHGANLNSAKNRGHHMRFKRLMGIVDEPTLREDFPVGKILHHSLMFVSGGFRTQCFLQAGGKSSYEQLRFGQDRVVGIDLAETVAQTLEVRGEHTSAADLVSHSLHVNNEIAQTPQSIYEWFVNNPSYAYEPLEGDEPPVLSMLEVQRLSVGLAASYIAVAANLRGGLELVPFLEPKSISDASDTPIYPLAG